MIDALNSFDVQGEPMEGQSGNTRSIIDDLQSWNIQGDQMEGESIVLLVVSL